MTEIETTTFKSRRGGLVFFGVLELAMGLLMLLLVALLVLTTLFASSRRTPGLLPAPIGQLLFTSSTYLAGGVLLACLGVGSILRRRWARDLSLVTAWVWLVFGTTTSLAMSVMIPRFLPAPAMPPGSRLVVFTCLGIVMGVFGIAVPLAMILFYRSPNVRATCLTEDPVPRWTERAPLPLLGLSFWVAISAFGTGAMSAYAVLPLPNTMITGAPAVLAYVAIAVVLFYVAWGIFFMRSRVAWWIGLLYGIGVCIYCITVIPRLDVQALMRAMGLPQTPGMPDVGAMYRDPWFFGWLAIFWVGYLGYFIFALRYFPRDSQAAKNV